MATNDNSLKHIGSIDFLDDIDGFVNMAKRDTKDNYPAVIQIPVFQSKRLLAKIINKVTALPLRLIRRSTTHYWYTQKQFNHELQREVDTLNARLTQMRKELNEVKGRGK